ncbi:LytTR family DNA-binding domain-containing protein [Winogradskyella maritima]|uniref:LytR/AlgR family response regulator transcription factor n=1 Tax=Winogradskyella maritima TaxID=1517766 RepID=A0ABV8AL89_9FLAO|nr:LytTR family DNA-binding domain-containing protein [Winogradskyella maritima]
MPKSINCLIVDDESIARDIIETHLSKMEGITVVGQCKNAFEAFNFIRNQAIDLVFLDINMPEVSGIAFARSINSDIKIIFTTAYRDYAVEGFDLQAVDYLMKPISFERLSKAVNRYIEIHTTPELKTETSSEYNDFIFVRSDRRMVKANFEDIRYVESYSDYVKLHLKSTSTALSVTSETIVTRETISAIEAKLPKQQFLRIHRSYIVALSHISSFTNESVTLGDVELTISRSYKVGVLERLEDF